MNAPGQRSNRLAAFRPGNLRREVAAARNRRRGRVPSRRFVLFAQGRSGTTLFMSTLGTHSEIHCDKEILDAPKLRPYRFTDDLSRSHDKPVYGYHAKIYHLVDAQHVSPAAFLRRAHEEGWTILYLYRANVVEHAVSNLFALESGRYHHFTGGSEGRPKQITVDPDELIRRARQRLDLLDDEREALDGLPNFTMNYERDLRDLARRTETLGRVQDLLGVRRETLIASTVKSVRNDISSVITNWDAVADAVRAAGLGHHLSPVRPAAPLAAPVRLRAAI